MIGRILVPPVSPFALFWIRTAGIQTIQTMKQNPNSAIDSSIIS